MLDYDAFRAEQAEARAARPLPRRRHVELRRAVDARLRLLRDRGRDDPHRAVGRGQRVHRRRLDREQHRDDGRAAHGRRARRRTSTTSTRSRATPRVTGFGAGAAGSRSGSMTAGAVRETAAILRERIVAIAAHKLEAAVDDIELADSRAIVRGTPAIGISFARDRRARVLRAARAAARRARPGSRRARATPPPRRSIWVNATHVCTCEVDVDDRARHAAALHRERGLRPDDQPERRRGPDRGRRRAGHRRRALRAPRVRRRRQPARHDVHGLPGADRGRGARRSSTGTSRRRAPGPGGYKGVGEGGAIGAPPAVVNAVADALAPFGVTVTRLPLTPVAHRRAPREGQMRPVERRLLRPVRRRDQRRSVPGVPPAARGSAALLQRAVRLLRGQPLRRRRARARRRARRTSPGAGGILELIKADIEMPPGVAHLRGPARRTPCTAACCRGCSRRRR